MKEVKAYICEYCNDELTMTTDVEWLKKHELLCEKNPANAELPCHCHGCANYKYSHTRKVYHSFYEQYMDRKYYRCTVDNVECTDKVCLQFIPKEIEWGDM